MCGIVAFTGNRTACPILLDALKRLEYRGYDSAGVAIVNGAGLDIRKKAGRIDKVAQACAENKPQGVTGISHTRWATHGEATDNNAHPHVDQSGKLAVVHNGVIENYTELRSWLKKEGHTFHSETDTEVLAHLIGHYYDLSKKEGAERLLDAVQTALPEVKGTYGIAVVHADQHDVIIGARRGSPLVIGLGEKENFLASDANALLGYTNKVIYLKDNDVVKITSQDFSVTTLEAEPSNFEIHELEFDAEDSEKGQFPHYMLKEIFEQPEAIRNAFRGRLDKEENSAKLGGLNMTPEELREIERIIVLACGTALHAGMYGEVLIEALAKIPVEIDFASEFKYRDCPLEKEVTFISVSQSGETLDTLGALKEAKRKGYRCLGICNNVGSTLARETDGGVYMHAGPEIGVAATKSFTSQTVVFALLGLLLGRMRFIPAAYGKKLLESIEAIPNQVETILETSNHIKKIAEKYAHAKDMLFLGRQYNYPIALEGALKMKEITYIHAAGHPSAELKHGVIALIDENLPSVFICPQDSLYEKNMNNIQEVKARKGKVIAVGTEGDEKISKSADDVFFVPKTLDCLQPILNVIPLQLFAYHTAVLLGRDVDKPRNLAKSVTVE